MEIEKNSDSEKSNSWIIIVSLIVVGLLFVGIVVYIILKLNKNQSPVPDTGNTVPETGNVPQITDSILKDCDSEGKCSDPNFTCISNKCLGDIGAKCSVMDNGSGSVCKPELTCDSTSQKCRTPLCETKTGELEFGCVLTSGYKCKTNLTALQPNSSTDYLALDTKIQTCKSIQGQRCYKNEDCASNSCTSKNSMYMTCDDYLSVGKSCVKDKQLCSPGQGTGNIGYLTFDSNASLTCLSTAQGNNICQFLNFGDGKKESYCNYSSDCTSGFCSSRKRCEINPVSGNFGEPTKSGGCQFDPHGILIQPSPLVKNNKKDVILGLCTYQTKSSELGDTLFTPTYYSIIDNDPNPFFTKIIPGIPCNSTDKIPPMFVCSENKLYLDNGSTTPALPCATSFKPKLLNTAANLFADKQVCASVGLFHLFKLDKTVSPQLWKFLGTSTTKPSTISVHGFWGQNFADSGGDHIRLTAWSGGLGSHFLIDNDDKGNDVVTTVAKGVSKTDSKNYDNLFFNAYRDKNTIYSPIEADRDHTGLSTAQGYRLLGRLELFNVLAGYNTDKIYNGGFANSNGLGTIAYAIDNILGNGDYKNPYMDFDISSGRENPSDSTESVKNPKVDIPNVNWNTSIKSPGIIFAYAWSSAYGYNTDDGGFSNDNRIWLRTNQLRFVLPDLDQRMPIGKRDLNNDNIDVAFAYGSSIYHQANYLPLDFEMIPCYFDTVNNRNLSLSPFHSLFWRVASNSEDTFDQGYSIQVGGIKFWGPWFKDIVIYNNHENPGSPGTEFLVFIDPMNFMEKVALNDAVRNGLVYCGQYDTMEAGINGKVFDGNDFPTNRQNQDDCWMRIIFPFINNGGRNINLRYAVSYRANGDEVLQYNEEATGGVISQNVSNTENIFKIAVMVHDTQLGMSKIFIWDSRVNGKAAFVKTDKASNYLPDNVSSLSTSDKKDAAAKVFDPPTGKTQEEYCAGPTQWGIYGIKYTSIKFFDLTKISSDQNSTGPRMLNGPGDMNIANDKTMTSNWYEVPGQFSISDNLTFVDGELYVCTTGNTKIPSQIPNDWTKQKKYESKNTNNKKKINKKYSVVK